MTIGIATVNLNIDVDKLLSKAWNKFLAIFGKDDRTQELKGWLEEHIRTAFLESRDVQCVGMHTPVLISEIYQPTRLVRRQPETISVLSGTRAWDAPEPDVVTVDRFLMERRNSVITAGPGWGKTTLLHAVFLHFLLAVDDRVLPILITLRLKSAVPELAMFVEKLKEIKVQRPDQRILLLVDGYDEIPADARMKVSELLLKFTVRNVGEYYLTCRDYYEIFDLKVPRLRIAEFSNDDQINFVTAFLRAYGSDANAGVIVRDLHARGFSDLLRHPLLLTLACIVKSSSLDIGTRNVVSLIEAALQTLSLRWDQGKGLRRETSTPLDGAARLKCLKRIAFTLDLEPATQQRVLGITGKQLELMRWDNVDPLAVLLEIAQFYGILVPVADRWGFVHKSLQDFLAAQYWVETGQFAEAVARKTVRFDSRTAFASCLVEDATEVMEAALQSKGGLPIFAEMLMNDPSFNHVRIARAIIEFYDKYKGEHYYLRTDDKVECYLDEEFISNASSKFLDYVVQVCSATRAKTTDTLAAYSIAELHRRRVLLSKIAYEACKKNYKSLSFAFNISKGSYLRFKDIRHM
jgi:hypothetical protein